MNESHAEVVRRLRLRFVELCVAQRTTTADLLKDAADLIDALAARAELAEAYLRDVSEILSDAGVLALTVRSGVIELRERAEKAEAERDAAVAAYDELVRCSQDRLPEAS